MIPAPGAAVVDSSLTMQTPEGIEYVLYPAGISARACAWGIDSLIKGAVLFGLLMVFIAMADSFGIWLFFILKFTLDWFYNIVFEMIWNGQTPGKRAIGIRVVGSDGSPVKAGASFLRNLLRFADGFFNLYLIAFICMSLSPGFRRIGDWAGDTLVIYTSRFRLSRRFGMGLWNTQAIPWLKDIPLQVPPGKLSYEEKQGLLAFARRYPLLGRERADEIARPWAARFRSGPATAPDSGGAKGPSDSEYLLGIAHFVNGVI